MVHARSYTSHTASHSHCQGTTETLPGSIQWRGEKKKKREEGLLLTSVRTQAQIQNETRASLHEGGYERILSVEDRKAFWNHSFLYETREKLDRQLFPYILFILSTIYVLLWWFHCLAIFTFSVSGGMPLRDLGNVLHQVDDVFW